MKYLSGTLASLHLAGTLIFLILAITALFKPTDAKSFLIYLGIAIWCAINFLSHLRTWESYTDD